MLPEFCEIVARQREAKIVVVKMGITGIPFFCGRVFFLKKVFLFCLSKKNALKIAPQLKLKPSGNIKTFFAQD